MSNRLAAERSPYLLQHAENPVDWYPWGQQAFDRARELDRPIFLSIGYSTCHWCHVMAHESFESEGIAEILNRDFISIKVDREERPDVDRVYMTFVQATTGSGGWPMSVWLTPDLKPFYGGTYFPPDARWGRPGFPEILREIVRVWQQERAKVQLSAENLTEQIRGTAVGVSRRRSSRRERAQRRGGAVRANIRSDTRRVWQRAEVSAAERAAVSLARDGANRRLHSGVHGGEDAAADGARRHARPRGRRVSSLFGRCQLARAALREDVVRPGADHPGVPRDLSAGGGPVFRGGRGRHARIRDARDDQSRRGILLGRRCGQRASRRCVESEGAQNGRRFLPLDPGRTAGAASEDDFDVFRFRFGIRPDGNAPEDPQGEFTGKNLLYVASTIEEIAERTGKSREDVDAALQRARIVLFQARLSRPRPHLDDKVLTGWNGLMLASFARAARVLPGAEARARYLGVAERSARFLERYMWDARPAGREAPLPRGRHGYRRVRRGLRVPHLRSSRAVPGGRKSALARVGASAAETPGRAVLGRRERRLVQHHRGRSQRHPADEGRLRRRRAVAELDLGAESSDDGAPDKRSRAVRSHRQNAEDVRAANRQSGARGADDDGRALDLSREGGADCHRRRERRCGDGAAHAGGRGEIRSVQCRRAGRAWRCAVTAFAHAAVHQRDERA